MRAIVVGVPGVGKTSVATELEKKGWKTVSFGTVMFEMAKEKFGIKHRDDMRVKIHGDKYIELQNAAAERIAEIEGNVLVDTHSSIKLGEGYLPGLPLNILQRLKPHAFIVIEAELKDILKWREKDASVRVRLEDPQEHQEFNRMFAISFSTITGAPVAFIMNRDGHLDETVREAEKILNMVKGDE